MAESEQGAITPEVRENVRKSREFIELNEGILENFLAINHPELLEIANIQRREELYSYLFDEAPKFNDGSLYVDALKKFVDEWFETQK